MEPNYDNKYVDNLLDYLTHHEFDQFTGEAKDSTFGAQVVGFFQGRIYEPQHAREFLVKVTNDPALKIKLQDSSEKIIAIYNRLKELPHYVRQPLSKDGKEGFLRQNWANDIDKSKLEPLKSKNISDLNKHLDDLLNYLDQHEFDQYTGKVVESFSFMKMFSKEPLYDLPHVKEFLIKLTNEPVLKAKLSAEKLLALYDKLEQLDQHIKIQGGERFVSWAHGIDKNKLLSDIKIAKKDNKPAQNLKKEINLLNIPKEISPESNFPISKTDAKKVFHALGDDWTKQFFDGKYHQYGEKVFDEGLHGGPKEPGYLASALNAFKFTEEHLCEPLTLDFYRELHKIACSHFQGEANRTEITASETGKIRDYSVPANFAKYNVRSLILPYLEKNPIPDQEELLDEYVELKNESYKDDNNSENIEVNKIIQKNQKDAIDWKFEYKMTPEIYKNLDAIFSKNFEKLDKYLQDLKNTNRDLSFLLPDIIYHKGSDTFQVYYKQEKFEEGINLLFTEFNNSISEINKQLQSTTDPQPLLDKKLLLIADIFQKLEWFHPFPDGQGRTDLFLLSKLLTENGFTPAVLFEPYLSTFSPLPEWVEYLKEGMSKWEALRNT